MCRSCGNHVSYVGKLPAIGFHAAVHVFKCQTCMTVHSKPARMTEPRAAAPSDGRYVRR
jgi:hypothetical protein